ncbi:MAG: hypothetical protein HOO06_13420 [Bdellovibrionaceae bacterium]|nr:hypothetical protein [Pseudobdellovibrionaceae bacterium]
MAIVFVTGVVLRVLIYYTVKRQQFFAKEFEKRVHNFIDEGEYFGPMSFYVITKRLLEKTYYEIFELKGIMRRRKHDYVTSLTDRLFLIQHGSAFLVRDSLKQIKYIKYNNHQPKLLEIVKNVFQNNPCFNRVFGKIPVGVFNDFLNVLPGLFIIAGIFGTFLGIMKGLPELKAMDITNVELTKNTMDAFLEQITYSMATSIIGIVFSVALTLLNTAFSPEKLFIGIVDRFENSLDLLWNRSLDNDIPSNVAEFDEHKDPVDALAEQAVLKEVENKKLTSKGVENKRVS